MISFQLPCEQLRVSTSLTLQYCTWYSKLRCHWIFSKLQVSINLNIWWSHKQLNFQKFWVSTKFERFVVFSLFIYTDNRVHTGQRIIRELEISSGKNQGILCISKIEWLNSFQITMSCFYNFSWEDPNLHPNFSK